MTWAQSLRLGLADSFEQELDRDDRFFAGGPYSVRGYPTESLGPQEDLGLFERPLGGQALIVVNQELRLQLLRSLTALLFFDAGNVWAVTGDIDFDLLTSTGIGARWISPVGLVRLDVALPLNRRPDDPSYKLHIGFGHTF